MRADEADRLNGRIREVEDRLEEASVAAPPAAGTVGVGSSVTVRFEDGTESTVRIAELADALDPGLVTGDSPLGGALSATAPATPSRTRRPRAGRPRPWSRSADGTVPVTKLTYTVGGRVRFLQRLGLTAVAPIAVGVVDACFFGPWRGSGPASPPFALRQGVIEEYRTAAPAAPVARPGGAPRHRPPATRLAAPGRRTTA